MVFAVLTSSMAARNPLRACGMCRLTRHQRILPLSHAYNDTTEAAPAATRPDFQKESLPGWLPVRCTAIALPRVLRMVMASLSA